MNRRDRPDLLTYFEWSDLGYRVGSPASPRYRLRDPYNGKSIPLYSRDDVVGLRTAEIVDTRPDEYDGPTI